jgi:hypothetical protein
VHRVLARQEVGGKRNLLAAEQVVVVVGLRLSRSSRASATWRGTAAGSCARAPDAEINTRKARTVALMRTSRPERYSKEKPGVSRARCDSFSSIR